MKNIGSALNTIMSYSEVIEKNNVDVVKLLHILTSDKEDTRCEAITALEGLKAATAPKAAAPPKITQDQFNKMSYGEMVELYNKNKKQYEQLRGKK